MRFKQFNVSKGQCIEKAKGTGHGIQKETGKERVKNIQKLRRNPGDHWNVHRREDTRETFSIAAVLLKNNFQ